ncbi:hypothetical protein R3W88_007833 [Solanum pinnatisectum]|uniref:Retrotransposon gag domain-containing protein n=1 Tax=Solanum pinnatisectum TaxID=50273 RepID=A0AAV9MA41_9SOLN|nr:hypothetical protein R3W88_007833 [Solanum pinnatisectum]
MHPFSQNEVFENLSETSKDGENHERHFNIETNQISLTNELASQLWTNMIEMENENEIPYNLIDIPMYDEIGISYNHLKAYLECLASIGKCNEFNMRLFVKTLIGPALMWYANQDTWKWLSWVEMEMKGRESQKEVAESTLGHYCLSEVRPRDKEKTTITKAPNVPPLVPAVRKTQNFTSLSEPISFIFEKLISLGILQEKPSEIPSHPFNQTKQCVFHSSMLGHITDEFNCLKEEIQKLFDNGIIIQRQVALEPTS